MVPFGFPSNNHNLFVCVYVGDFNVEEHIEAEGSSASKAATQILIGIGSMIIACTLLLWVALFQNEAIGHDCNLLSIILDLFNLFDCKIYISVKLCLLFSLWKYYDSVFLHISHTKNWKKKKKMQHLAIETKYSQQESWNRALACSSEPGIYDDQTWKPVMILKWRRNFAKIYYINSASAASKRAECLVVLTSTTVKLPFPLKWAKTFLYFTVLVHFSLLLNGIFQEHDLYFGSTFKNRLIMPSLSIKNPHFLHFLASSFSLLCFNITHRAFTNRISLSNGRPPSPCCELLFFLLPRFFFQYLSRLWPAK